ncbi:BTAD domain-containing putative transcriptional regulator [Streptomyces gobiensis]|uniref:BTAD domain-containing putative transcriptional regulator n=1 Tax=Streptomyces gobiensis TaxID=2875706 RepID=UPI001E34AA5F|nr:BTAD domain-containing putative transcriptional regulator [Streptomyces gobiensis]UGY91068.1 AfsR family transcriptional regulator [Streptomyces gobiensis]
MGYRYRILGTTQVLRDDGTTVPLGGARLRALLTALAMAQGRTVRADTLVGEVWAQGDPPADATGALQALIGRLRRLLGREAIASEHDGYRLCAGPDEVDAARFARLADDGARALADGDAGQAARLLEGALALWRGPAFADLPDGGGPAAVRAEARQLEVRRGRAEAQLALGRPESVLAELAELCAEHPLDEPLQALRMRALRDAGRTAEALAAYETVRAEIVELLGADPGVELRALHAELLLPPEPPPQQAPAPAPAPAPAAAPARAAGNLRARLTSFVGREEELAEIRTELGRYRLVTLLGPGGAGKTRLSQEAADAVAGQWPDGVWLAELAPTRDPDTVAETVLTALGGRETVIRGTTAEGLRAATDPHALDPLAQLAERCAHQRMLLLLDNCEHVIDAAARLVEKLLTECPQVTVLATSREPLGVPGESALVVDPLPDPVALRLLEERGAVTRPGFRTDQDPAACAEICRRLDGLPLAIELAAARLRALTPRQLADRLDNRFRLLTSGSRTALPRQQTLRAVVDWSWELLDAPERAVLRRLSVFSGGCELAQAEAVCSGDGVDPRDVTALLGSLVDKSLVVAAPTPGNGMRYRLLETVGEYAAERLAEAGERSTVEQRHLVTYRELARTTDALLRGPEQRRHLDRLESEHDNIRTALRHALDARDEHEALCLALSMSWFWQLRDHRTDARTWCRAAAALGPNPFEPPVIPAPPLAEGCTDAPPPMDPEQLWEARRGVRMVELAVAEPFSLDAATEPETRELLRGIVDSYRPGQPQTCRNPGLVWFYACVLLGEFTRLPELMDATVTTCRELGYDWELGYALQMRSRLRGDIPHRQTQAIRDADESLEIFTRLDNGWGMAEALSSRGEMRERRGDLAGAIEDTRRGIRIAEGLGAQSQVSMLRARLGGALVESGQGEAGERLLRETLAESERLTTDAVPLARLHLTTWLGRTGRLAECREQLDALVTDFGKGAARLFLGMVEGLFGWLETLEGRPETARTRFRTAIEETRDQLGEMIVPELAISYLAMTAEAVCALDRAPDAARLLGAFGRLYPPHWYQPAMLRESRERAERATRAALGDAAYERAYAEGGELSMTEAAALI